MKLAIFFQYLMDLGLMLVRNLDQQELQGSAD